MFIPYALKLRLEKYKRDKQEAAKLEEDIQKFLSLPIGEQQSIAESIEQRMLSQVKSKARTKLTELQRLRHNQIMRNYRARKKEMEREANGGILISNYTARNPVLIKRIKIKGEDF